ncbi:hypothetical protein RIF29_35000 [Crotalaria pallida]|uniref:Uncharacterized protein n=1 Tax=Crotalaria pallida TaxID=3830 RepID=A0AAN9HXP9_CROPI
MAWWLQIREESEVTITGNENTASSDGVFRSKGKARRLRRISRRQWVMVTRFGIEEKARGEDYGEERQSYTLAAAAAAAGRREKNRTNRQQQQGIDGDGLGGCGLVTVVREKGVKIPDAFL